MIRYWPLPSVTTVRTFSLRFGLDASTVTPGNTAPDVSRTTPVIDAWAYDATGTTRSDTHAMTTTLTIPRITGLPCDFTTGPLRSWQSPMAERQERCSGAGVTQAIWDAEP